MDSSRDHHKLFEDGRLKTLMFRFNFQIKWYTKQNELEPVHCTPDVSAQAQR